MRSGLRARLERSVKYNNARDRWGLWWDRLRGQKWPHSKRKYLLVGPESSGTTAISHLLLRNGQFRFFFEGDQPWVWDMYMDVYQGHRHVRDFPRLRLYDALKVPGFASILPQFIEEYPNTRVVCTIRDPRGVVASAYRTWKIRSREELANINWVKETWLGIQEQDPVARLAIRWRTYVERVQQVPGVEFARYEDFCQDKVGFIQRLAERLQLTVDERRLRESCDRQASDQDAREYQPQGARAEQEPLVTAEDVRIIEEICGDQMRQWGYLPTTADGPRTQPAECPAMGSH